MGVLGSLKVEFQANRHLALFREPFQVDTYPTAVFKYASLEAFASCAFDHLQASFLPAAPHIGWFSPQSRLLHVPVSHVSAHAHRLGRPAAPTCEPQPPLSRSP